MPSDCFGSPKKFARRPKLKRAAKGDEYFRKEMLLGLQDQSLSQRRTGSTLGISLESLGSDIWFLISSYVPKSTLVSICRTSRHFHSNVIPVLYHTIDLSIHAPPDGTNVSFTYRRKTCECQYIFLRQILRRPEYGQYVRSLKWTVGFDDEKLVFRPDFVESERVVWRSDYIEKLFECLDQVVTLDIESTARDDWRIFEGRNFFPAAQRVNLVSSVLFFLSPTSERVKLIWLSLPFTLVFCSHLKTTTGKQLTQKI